jgi:mono/diheme cytochrome c family protein
MKRGFFLMVLLMSIGGGFFLVSCSRDREGKKVAQEEMGEHGMPSNWKFALPKGDPIEGRKIFVEMECYKCHEIRGESFPATAAGEKGVGPELSQMAGMHPVEFFAESVINPNAVIDEDDKVKGYLGEDGKSRMPDYNDILTVKQISDLAAYLVSLKSDQHAVH